MTYTSSCTKLTIWNVLPLFSGLANLFIQNQVTHPLLYKNPLSQVYDWQHSFGISLPFYRFLLKHAYFIIFVFMSIFVNSKLSKESRKYVNHLLFPVPNIGQNTLYILSKWWLNEVSAQVQHPPSMKLSLITSAQVDLHTCTLAKFTVWLLPINFTYFCIVFLDHVSQYQESCHLLLW